LVVPDPDKLLESLERFATTLTGGYGVGDVLHDLTAEITDVLDLTGAGVTLVHDGRQRFVTAAVDAIARLERVQEDHQRGPCVDAVTTARAMTVSDLDDGAISHRWPDYADAARTAGIRAVAGIPMLAEGSAVGAVNLYGKEPTNWSAEDLRVAAVFANIATGYLVHASAAQQHQRTTEQLQQALSTRVVIEQAKGVLATQHDIGVDEAFLLLRTHARIHRARLHDVARAVVDGDLHLPVR
jgi:GAF domain-containing protein